MPQNFQSSRRRFLQTAAGAGLAVGARMNFAAAQGAPIKIGVLNSFSRAFASYGEATWNGLTLYFEQIGWTSAGRKIELIKEDDEITPQVGLQKMRKLVESDKVDVLCGPLASQVAMAMVGYMRQSQCLWMVTGATATELTFTRLPFMFRTTISSWQTANPMGKWVYDNLAKEAVLTGSDFVAGHDAVNAFKASFVASGGKVLKEIYPPLGTTDFSAFLADIRSIAPPATYNFYGGSDSIRFVRQYAEYGVKDKSLLIGFNSLLDNDTFVGQGASALGGYTSSIYCDTLDTPENKKFVEAYRARFKDFPSTFAESGYLTGAIIDKALQAVDGNPANKEKFAASVAATKMVAPRGPVYFNQNTHQLIQNVYVRKAVQLGDRITNVAVATIPEVRDPESKPG